MSDLKQADIQELMRYIRKKTKKGPGYVWDFNDLTFIFTFCLITFIVTSLPLK